MTEFRNNNDIDSPHMDLVDNSNNRVDSCKETARDNNLSHACNTHGQESLNEEQEQEEQDHIIRIPFFTLDKYKKGLISNFDEIIGIFE